MEPCEKLGKSCASDLSTEQTPGQTSARTNSEITSPQISAARHPKLIQTHATRVATLSVLP